MSSYSIDALVIPTEDAHQSEYVAETDKRRAFISGFTGNAGLAVITKNEALLWTDGHYFLQATQELSNSWKLMRIVEDPVVETWLADNLTEGASAGVDPWCISVGTAYVQPLEFAGRPVSEKLSNLREKLSQEKSRAIIIAALDEVAWLYNIRG